MPPMPPLLLGAMFVHGGLVLLLLWRLWRSGAGCQRIDGTLFLTSQFVLWFSVWPLVASLS